MTRHSHGGPYPQDWPLIAFEVKGRAGWKCVRCGHEHDPLSGHCLTVHHIDLNPSNNAWWNLAPLCQKCHLIVQAKVDIHQPFMFEHSEWFKPFVAGYNAHQRGFPDDRDYVMEHLSELLTMIIEESKYEKDY